SEGFADFECGAPGTEFGFSLGAIVSNRGRGIAVEIDAIINLCVTMKDQCCNGDIDSPAVRGIFPVRPPSEPRPVLRWDSRSYKCIVNGRLVKSVTRFECPRRRCLPDATYVELPSILPFFSDVVDRVRNAHWAKPAKNL